MKRLKTALYACPVLALAACGGGGHLSVENPGGGQTLDLEFPPGQAVEHRLPLRISGGIPPYESSLLRDEGEDDNCPGWVTLFPDQRILAGTAPAADAGGTFFCIYRIAESDPGFRAARSVDYGLRLRVGTSGSDLSLPHPGRFGLSVGNFHSAPLPAATGGVRPYVYTFTCVGGGLPPGMGFGPQTQTFSGTPEASFRDSCTYSVTDSSVLATTVSQAVEVEVAGPSIEPLELDDPGKLDLSVGSFHGAPLPAATGGVEPYAYSFTCASGMLPPGMGFARETRIFAGTPNVRFRDSCTYSVTDRSQPAAMVSVPVEVEVAGPITGTLMLPRQGKVDLSVGTFHDIALPAATGGVQPYTYAFECAGGPPPPGMNFAPATRRLAGTPEAPFRDSCAYSVTDRSQPAAMVSVPVEVEVAGPITGTLMLPRQGKVDLSVGTFHDMAFPAASGGVQPYTYAFECAGGSPPPGMNFAPATRRLAGTPEAPFRDSCTYSVTDGSTIRAMVSRAVEVEVTSAETEPLALPENVVRADGGEQLDRVSLIMGQRARIPFVEASGGVQPYTYELLCDLPDGVSFSRDTRILSGSPEEVYRGPDCTYRVTDSASPRESVSRSVPLIVDPLDLGEWRFRTRTVQPGGPCALRAPISTPVAILPLAHQGISAETGEDRYKLTDVPSRGSNDFLTFDPGTRRLTYTHRSADPVLGTPTTYRYLVGTDASVEAANAHDALCVDVQYNTGPSGMCGNPNADPPEDPQDYIHISLRIRDDAYHDGTEWRCPDTTAPAPRSSAQGVSNPVHEALGPVHARRALDVAHGAVRDRVRGWTPGAPRVLTAIAPQIGIGSLSGKSDGFDYTGSSESVSTGAEVGSGSWQAGLVGSYTRTELHYRAEARLAERGYRSGEHATEILSLHPFAAWHMPSGGNVWTSLGAGTGKLRHRDDLGFPSRSRSDVRLRAYAAGASVPVADILAGEIEAEAGLEAFAFEIEGGGRISSALPTLRGRDWRAGLTWSAPVRGAPSLSVAYRHLTGDGPEGGQLETRGSVSVDGILDPRLSLISTVEGAFGLGDREHKSWGLSGGVRFAPGEDRRGFGVDIDTRLVSPDGGGSAEVGLRGEAGYGMRGGPLFPTLRPFAGFTRYSGDGSLRRSLGIDLRDTPGSRVRVEAWDRPRHRLRAIRFALRHRF